MTIQDKPLEYDSIYQQGKAFKSTGKMKMVQGGIGWKESATSTITTLRSEDFSRIVWARCARDYQLAFLTKKDVLYKFDGFPKEAYETLKGFVSDNYNVSLEVKEYSLKGWSWGKCQLQDDHLAFNIQEKPSFELPLREVANASVSAKHEVTVELVQNDSTPSAKRMDSLVDIRFYIPPNTGAGEESMDVDLVDAATAFCNTLKSSTETGGMGTAERIVTFQELPFVVPRGRYEADIYLNVIRLRGKSYDYKIPYDSILKIFLLPRPDDLHVAMVIALDPPLRQGQTRYPFLIIQFARDAEVESKLALTSEVKSQLAGKLQETYAGPLYEVFSTVLKTVSDKKIIVPGSFKSAHGVSCVKCSMKANEGHLYCLERSFIFIQKPVILIPHEDLVSITFSRVDTITANSRTFDMLFTCRGGVDYSFSNLNKEELPSLETFLREKKIKFQNELVNKKKVVPEVAGSSSEDEVSVRGDRSGDEDESSTDEDYQEGDDETSEGSDASADDSEAGSDSDDDAAEDDE